MPLLPATGGGLAAAEDALRAGDVVVVPTDTVYGVAVEPTRPGAVDRLFALKRRPRDVPLAVLVAGRDQLAGLVDGAGDPRVAALAEAFWPGGLTLVLRRRAGLALDLGAAGETVGVRCPDHPVPRALAERVGPLAATSANLHGMETPSTATGVAAQLELGPGIVVLDGGPCGGVASTVVELTGDEPRLLREGTVPWDEITAAI